MKKLLWLVALPFLLTYMAFASAFRKRPLAVVPASATPRLPPAPLVPHLAADMVLETGDVVNTPQGPVRVIGVDEKGVAWCEYIRRPMGLDFEIGLHHPVCMDARAGMPYRVDGVKHSWMEKAS